MIVEALLLGLGVMKAVDFIESLIPWPQKTWLKILYSAILSVMGVLILGLGNKTVPTVSGTIGIAAIGHAIEALLLARKDVLKAELIKMMRGVRY